MKKEIINLINSANATLTINKFCKIRRWTKDALNNDVDRLEVEFSIKHVYDYSAEINARDWQGVINEVQEHQTKAFAAAAATYNKELKNGYLSR